MESCVVSTILISLCRNSIMRAISAHNRASSEKVVVSMSAALCAIIRLCCWLKTFRAIECSTIMFVSWSITPISLYACIYFCDHFSAAKDEVSTTEPGSFQTSCASLVARVAPVSATWRTCSSQCTWKFAHFVVRFSCWYSCAWSFTRHVTRFFSNSKSDSRISQICFLWGKMEVL